MLPSLLGGIRHRSRRYWTKRAERLDPIVRDELASTVTEALVPNNNNSESHRQVTIDNNGNNVVDAGESITEDIDIENQNLSYAEILKLLDDELIKLELQLERFESTQSLVEKRLAKYEGLWARLSPEEQQSPIRAKQRQGLDDISRFHASNEESISQLHQRIRTMQLQRLEVVYKLEECHDFLNAASKVRVNRENGNEYLGVANEEEEDDDEDDEEDVLPELSPENVRNNDRSDDAGNQGVERGNEKKSSPIVGRTVGSID